MRVIPGDWAARALCAEVSGDLFYPELGEDAERAKAVCRGCEVRVECLEYSLEIDDREGIFGGFTERIRRGIARQHRAGKPLEDIIAEDDAVHYARLERSAELAEAAAKRHRTRERERHRAARVSLQEEIAS